jgi:sugar phosphate isomerase/epimerase
MQRMLRWGVAVLIAMGAAIGNAPAADVGQSKSFRGPTGLQLYSLRDMMKAQGPAAVLDKARQWGFKYVEVADTGGLTPAAFRAELDKRGLVPIGKHFPYERLRDDIDGVIAEAKGLGLPYVGCAWIGHKAPFDEKQCREAAAVFNRAGKALAKHGMKFYYHNHGYEFGRHASGTLFDLLAAETDPRHVFFQMDVLWTVHPGQDPARLIEKYPSRWLLLHLKDLRKGVPTGPNAGKTALTDDVALGSGQVVWPALLRACQKAGVKYYFIEDESPTVVEQVPQSLRFLEQVEF